MEVVIPLIGSNQIRSKKKDLKNQFLSSIPNPINGTNIFEKNETSKSYRSHENTSYLLRVSLA